MVLLVLMMMQMMMIEPILINVRLVMALVMMKDHCYLPPTIDKPTSQQL
jgi:hypothetical protein